jgi:hypothetical protein
MTNILSLKYNVWYLADDFTAIFASYLPSFFLSCRGESSKDKLSESHPESIDHNNKYSGYFLPDILFRMSSSLRMRILGTEPSSEKMSGIWIVQCL